MLILPKKNIEVSRSFFWRRAPLAMDAVSRSDLRGGPWLWCAAWRGRSKAWAVCYEFVDVVDVGAGHLFVWAR